MHTSPDVLALLALGEEVGTQAELAHLQDCHVCRTELSQLSHAVEVGRRTSKEDGLQSPRPEIWEAVRAELGFDDQPARTADVVQIRSRPPGGRRLVSLALAAVLALIVGIGIGVGADRLMQPRETVIGRADLEPLPDWPGSSGKAVVERDPQGNRILVVTVDSPRAADGAARQVWLIDKQIKGMSPMGFLNNGRGEFNIPDSFNLSEFPIVDVSVEPANDPDPTHSGHSVVRGTLST
jgi:anti-sigma-K factor RskA